MSFYKKIIVLCLALNLAGTISFAEDEFEDFDFGNADIENIDIDDDFGDFDDFGEFDDLNSDIDSEFDEFNFAEEEAVVQEAEPVQADQVIEAEPADLEAIEAETVEEMAEEPLLEEFQGEPEDLNFDDVPFEEAPVQDVFVDSGPQNSPPISDEPDYALESKLHNIYVNFHDQETSAEQWRAISAGRDSESYFIQEGDSLWSISGTLFGDGNYWPKVWSLNSRITNPHLIRPQNSIRFLPGTESEPPSFTVADQSLDVDVDVDVNVQSSEGSTQLQTEPIQAAADEDNVDIPPPTSKSRPVVRKLPPTFPKWQDLSTIGEYDELGIDYAKRKIVDLIDEIPLSSYIVEEPPTSAGQVSEIEGGSRIASALQYIYVEVNVGEGQVGNTYLVVSNTGPVESATELVQGFLGFSIQIQGEIQLVEKVSTVDADSKRETYRAIVTKMVNPVSVGSMLTEGNIQQISLAEEGPRSQVVAQIIGGQYFNKRQVYGSESVAYINKGANAGIEPGQLLSIRENRRIRNPESNVQENVRPVGWLKIVKVTPRFSTGVIIRAWSDILTGDLTGAGSFVKDLDAQNVSVDESQITGSLSDEFDSDSSEAPNTNQETDEFGDFEFEEGGEGESDDEFGDEFQL